MMNCKLNIFLDNLGPFSPVLLAVTRVWLRISPQYTQYNIQCDETGSSNPSKENATSVL